MDRNDASTWITSEIHTPPAGVDVKGYQARIDAICGKTLTGESNVKLVWMPDMENYSKYYYEWDDAGFGTKWNLRGQYVFHTLYDGDRPLDIPPPRWAIKQRVDPAQYAQDDVTRWAKSERGQQVLVRELRPPKPSTGYYIPYMRIGKHNAHCCKDAQKEKPPQTCWGDYRTLDDKHLDLLRKAVAIREAENGQRPDEPLSQKTLMQAALEGATIAKVQKAVGEQWLDNLLDEHLDSMVNYYTGGQTKSPIISSLN